MSCFICKKETFQRVAKVAFVCGLHGKFRGKFPLTLDEVNMFMRIIAGINCLNYMSRYEKHEDVSGIREEVEEFSELPDLKITAQDIKSTQCWMYQTEDYYDKDEYFQLVKQALDWALKYTHISKEDLEKAKWE